MRDVEGALRGGMLTTTTPEFGEHLSGAILSGARSCGAIGIVTTCPLGQLNSEAYQKHAAPGAQSVLVLFFT